MFSRKCRTLTVLILLLVVIGVIMVGSSSRVWASAKFNDASYFMSRQAVFALIGVFVMYVASRISLTKLRRYGKKLFILCVITLILVLIPGLGIQRNGSRSWFGVGSFLIQPSEFFKIAIIIYVADFLAKRYRIKTFKRILEAAWLWSVPLSSWCWRRIHRFLILCESVCWGLPVWVD